MRFPLLRVAPGGQRRAGDRRPETADGREGGGGYQLRPGGEFLWPPKLVGQQRRELEKVLCEFRQLYSGGPSVMMLRSALLFLRGMSIQSLGSHNRSPSASLDYAARSPFQIPQSQLGILEGSTESSGMKTLLSSRVC